MLKIVSKILPIMFLDSREIKKIWFYLNILFVANYSLSILRMFIRIPLPRLPNIFNILFLISVYAITLIDILKNVKKLFSHPNTFCLFLFFTLPHQILLFPFFILSIYHINSFILSQKKTFERMPFFNICAMIGQHTASIGKLAMYSEVLDIPISILMMIFRKASIWTVLAFVLIVRQQYFNNSVMKGVIGEILMHSDTFFNNMPECFNSSYIQLKNLSQRCNKTVSQKEKSE